MAFVVYEYETVTPWGEPVAPASIRTEKAAASALRIAANTRYVEIAVDADTYVRISEDGAAATAKDRKIPAGENRGFPVAQGARPYVYGL